MSNKSTIYIFYLVLQTFMLSVLFGGLGVVTASACDSFTTKDGHSYTEASIVNIDGLDIGNFLVDGNYTAVGIFDGNKYWNFIDKSTEDDVSRSADVDLEIFADDKYVEIFLMSFGDTTSSEAYLIKREATGFKVVDEIGSLYHKNTTLDFVPDSYDREVSKGQLINDGHHGEMIKLDFYMYIPSYNDGGHPGDDNEFSGYIYIENDRFHLDLDAGRYKSDFIGLSGKAHDPGYYMTGYLAGSLSLPVVKNKRSQDFGRLLDAIHNFDQLAHDDKVVNSFQKATDRDAKEVVGCKAPDAHQIEQSEVPGKIFKDCVDCPEMMVMPPGKIIEGSNKSGPDAAFKENERPQHLVVLSHAFAVGLYPVTLAEFSIFAKATGQVPEGNCPSSNLNGLTWRSPGFDQSGNSPVVCVSWQDAQAYVSWLSKSTGGQYRLLLTRQLRLSDILRAWKKKLTHANYQLRFLRRSAGRRTCYENAE